ncbi:MAG TPA: WhiB family transcriptional regulator [Kribbellaceae bacterium]|nr:WhiB family transcriptional regulator [Kribbellaceae bacterium]
MTVKQFPGQLELTFDIPELADDLRAELAAHVVPGWERMGECRSIADDSWFPDEWQTDRKAEAVDRCSWCPVRRSCLANALAEGEEYGVWGGTTEAQRLALRVGLADGVPVVDVLDSVTIRPAYLWRRAS